MPVNNWTKPMFWIYIGDQKMEFASNYRGVLSALKLIRRFKPFTNLVPDARMKKALEQGKDFVSCKVLIELDDKVLIRDVIVKKVCYALLVV